MSSMLNVALKATGKSAVKVAGILAAQKATLSISIVDGNHKVFQIFGNSDSYRNVSS